MDRIAMLALWIVGTAAAVAVPAQAGQISASMPVTLIVQPACRVSAAPMAFAGDAGTAIDAESQIAIACNGEVPLVVTLDGGMNYDGSERRLAGEDRYVSYRLYSDRTRQSPWSAGTPLAATARGGRLELAAYGRIDADATVSARGTYADTVAITVDF